MTDKDGAREAFAEIQALEREYHKNQYGPSGDRLRAVAQDYMWLFAAAFEEGDRLLETQRRLHAVEIRARDNTIAAMKAERDRLSARCSELWDALEKEKQRGQPVYP